MVCKHDWEHIYDEDGPSDKQCKICFIYWSDIIKSDIAKTNAKIARRRSTE